MGRTKRTPERPILGTDEERPPILLPAGVGASPIVGWLSKTFASLAHRDYRLFFIGQGISLVGTWMRTTAQGWLVYEMTGSKLLLGTVAGLGLLPLFLFSAIAGAVADHMPKRRLLLVAQTTMMIVSLTVAILIYLDLIRVWHLMVSAALIGMAFAVDLPTRQSFFVELVGRERLFNAIALNSAAFNAARMIGPAVAGLLMTTLGIASCFFADALSFVAVITSLLLIRTPEQAPRFFGKSPVQMLREGFSYVLATRRVRVLLLLLAVTGIFGWSYTAVMPAFAQDVLQLDEAGYGVLMALNGVGALAGALFVANRGQGKNPRTQVFAGLWIFAGALFGFALSRDAWLANILIAISGAGLIAFLSTANTLIQLHVPDELRGRVMGVWGWVFGGALPVGSFLMGAVAQELGVVMAIALGALTCVVVSVAVYLSLPEGPAPEKPRV